MPRFVLNKKGIKSAPINVIRQRDTAREGKIYEANEWMSHTWVSITCVREQSRQFINIFVMVRTSLFCSYTGHCPTLKFRFGKRYGANTKEIIDELRDISPVKFTKPYKHGEPWSNVFKETKREKSEEFDPIVHTSLPIRPFILGYTGKAIFKTRWYSGP